jgi:hypothetical protein
MYYLVLGGLRIVNIKYINILYSTIQDMPRKGFRSITVREEIYDELMQQYKENREELLKQGVTSFSGYVTRFLYDALEQAAQQTH